MGLLWVGVVTAAWGQPATQNASPDLDYAQVEFVRAAQAADGSWSFTVTVRHDDQGWGHYADRWQVMAPDNETPLGERILLHPHDTEQPFTRSQAGVRVPAGMTAVSVRAACNVHGHGGRAVLVDLQQPAGEGNVREARPPQS